MTITVEVTKEHYIAAIMAASYADGNPDPQSWLQGVIDAACRSYESQYKVNFIPLAQVMTRLTAMGKLETILTAAQNNEQLGQYWLLVQRAGGIWSGSDDSIAGTAALVAVGMLTQEEADALLAYPTPVYTTPINS